MEALSLQQLPSNIRAYRTVLGHGDFYTQIYSTYDFKMLAFDFNRLQERSEVVPVQVFVHLIRRPLCAVFY